MELPRDVTLTLSHQDAKVTKVGYKRIVTRLPESSSFRQLGMLSFKDSSCR